MGRKRRFGRPVNGVVLIDKAAGMTSNDVVQKVKRLFFANKAGHTGALDPLATGVLPICLGEATKFSQYLLDSDKAYISTYCIGVSTDTCDADGEVKGEVDASALTRSDVEAAMGKYRGQIDQVPPMYSALKKNGTPLYKLAREGKEVEREARAVEIYEYTLLDFEPGPQAKAKVLVRCSKGTYIRSLAQDLGEDLAVGAHVASLRRVVTGEFAIDGATTLEALTQERGEQAAECLDHHLLPMDAAVRNLPKICLDDDSGFYFTQGQAVMDVEAYRIAGEGGTVRVFQAQDRFLGLGELTDDGKIAPRRLVVY